ncbi:MAG: hypothetical protein RL701_3729 [Pseudomonadota bacterium]|jgi:hypothetical protein
MGEAALSGWSWQRAVWLAICVIAACRDGTTRSTQAKRATTAITQARTAAAPAACSTTTRAHLAMIARVTCHVSLAAYAARARAVAARLRKVVSLMATSAS